MGVRGLTTFIDDNPDLLYDYKLCDTKLVIDGSNFYHFVYYNMNLVHQYGGDYDMFASRIRQVFQAFLDCRVQPYVVFDGAYTRDDRKLSTTLDRARNRIFISDSISRGCAGKLLPILAYETFVNVLEELGILHVTTDLEADDQIVLLANQLHCPVLSNDSDFYIFDLSAGYIITDYVNFDPTKNTDDGSAYLSCQIYFVDHFVESFEGLTKSNLPLAATVLGNDFTTDEGFNHFFASLKMPNATGKKNYTNRRYHKLLKLFHWMGMLESPERAKEAILQFVGPKTRDKMREIIELCCNGYRELTPGFDLINFFENRDQFDGTTSLRAYNGSEVPGWILVKFRKAELPVFMLNVITLHRSILLCQVEHTQSPSAYTCSLRLREIIYGILLRDDLQMTLSRDKDKRQTMVQEYSRDIKNCQKTYVEPCLHLENFGDLPGLSTLQSLHANDSKNLLFAALCLNQSSLSEVCPTLMLYIMCMVYWVRNATPKVSSHHLKSLLLCIVYLGVKKIQRMSKSDPEGRRCTLSMESVFESSTKQQHSLLVKNLEKFSRRPNHNHRNYLQPQIVHGFAQFQTCLLMTVYLNKLLGCPLFNPNPAECFNGSFLYNLCYDLQSRKVPELFVSEMLVKKSPFDQLFQSLQQLVMDHLTQGETDSLNSSDSSSKKGGKRQRTKQRSVVSSEQTDTSVDDIKNDKKVKVRYEATCELNNRFASFSVDGEDSD